MKYCTFISGLFITAGQISSRVVAADNAYVTPERDGVPRGRDGPTSVYHEQEGEEP